LQRAEIDPQSFLKGLNPAWNLVGRVHFNLAENRNDPSAPSPHGQLHTRLSAQARAQHLPLGQAMREYSGAANRDKLLSLLMPVQRAAEALVAAIDGRRRRDIPSLRWTPGEAARFLSSAPQLESAGVVCACRPLGTPTDRRGAGRSHRRARAPSRSVSTVCSTSAWT